MGMAAFGFGGHLPDEEEATPCRSDAAVHREVKRPGPVPVLGEMAVFFIPGMFGGMLIFSLIFRCAWFGVLGALFSIGFLWVDEHEGTGTCLKIFKKYVVAILKVISRCLSQIIKRLVLFIKRIIKLFVDADSTGQSTISKEYPNGKTKEKSK